MYKPEECTKMVEGTLKKKRVDFSQQEKKILNNIIKDNLMGRYNPLIRFTGAEITEFLRQTTEYFELSDPERWAVEDVYTGNV